MRIIIAAALALTATGAHAQYVYIPPVPFYEMRPQQPYPIQPSGINPYIPLQTQIQPGVQMPNFPQPVHVQGYQRQDGGYVQGYNHSAPSQGYAHNPLLDRR